jgi:hypothetical protein
MNCELCQWAIWFYDEIGGCQMDVEQDPQMGKYVPVERPCPDYKLIRGGCDAE